MGDDQINIRLSSEQKQQWKNHADEHTNYTSLSHLIRVAVNTQIHHDTTDDRGTSAVAELDVDISDDIDSLEDKIDAIHDSVTTVETIIRQNEYQSDLKQRIFENLIVKDEADIKSDLNHPERRATGFSGWMSVPEIADTISEPIQDVRRAARELDDEMATVYRVVHEDGTNYYIRARP